MCTPACYDGHGFPTIRYFSRHNSLHTAPRRAQTWPTDPLDGWYSLKLNSTSFRCTRYPPRAPRAPSRMRRDSTLSKGRRASTATAAPGIGAPSRSLQDLLRRHDEGPRHLRYHLRAWQWVTLSIGCACHFLRPRMARMGSGQRDSQARAAAYIWIGGSRERGIEASFKG